MKCVCVAFQKTILPLMISLVKFPIYSLISILYYDTILYYTLQYYITNYYYSWYQVPRSGEKWLKAVKNIGDMESPYDMVQLKITLPRIERDGFYLMVSRKWPVYDHGCIYLEARLALKMWMVNDGETAHTHENTVLSEAENKPSFHRRTKKVRVKVDSEPIPSPSPTPTDPIVLTNNGKSSGEDGQSKSSSKSDFDILEWANMMGIKVEDKHVQMATRMRSDPEFMEQTKKEWIARLEAKQKRRVVSDVDKKTSDRRKDHTEIMNQIVAYIRNNPNSRGINVGGKYYSVDDGLMSKEDLEQGIIVICNVKDPRVINSTVKMFEASGIITWTNFDQGRILGKPSGKRILSRGAYKINTDSL